MQTRAAHISRLLSPCDAIAVGTDRSLNDCAAGAGDEIEAVAAPLVSVGLIRIVHRFFRCLLRTRLFARHESRGQSGTGQERSTPKNRPARYIAIPVHVDSFSVAELQSRAFVRQNISSSCMAMS